MSRFFERSAGLVGVALAGLMILTSCGTAKATPVPPTATTKPVVATAVPAATATTPPAVPTQGNSGGAAVGDTVQTKIIQYAAADVKQGGTLHGTTTDPQTFNPYAASTGASPPMFLITHQKLIRYQSIVYPEYAKWGAGIFKGDLVDTWDITNGGKTFTLHLKHGIMWPALTNVSGDKPVTLPAREVVASDVLYSWARMKSDPISLVKSFYAPVVGTPTAPDNYTLVVNTDQAYADWIGTTFANGETQFVVRADYVDAMGTKYGLGQESMWGSGSFMPGGYTTGGKYTFVRNPTYFVPGLPHLDAVELLVIKDVATQQAAYLSGQLDTLGGTKADVQRFQTQDKDIAVWRGEALSHNPQGGQFNNAKGPGSIVAVRQAVSKLFPWPRIISDQYFGEGAYDGCIPAGYVNLSLSQEQLKALYPYDPKGAVALLAAAGYTKANPLVFDSLYDATSTLYNDQVTALSGEIDSNGGGLVKMNLKNTPSGQARTQALSGNFDLYWGPLSTGTPTKIMNSFYGGTDGLGPPGGQNWMGIRDPKIDAWFQQQSVEFNVDKRRQIIQDFETYCAQNALVLPTPTPPSYTSARGWLKNYAYLDYYNDENSRIWLWIDKTGF